MQLIKEPDLDKHLTQVRTTTCCQCPTRYETVGPRYAESFTKAGWVIALDELNHTEHALCPHCRNKNGL